MAVTGLGSARAQLVDRDGAVAISVSGSPAAGDGSRALRPGDLFDLASVTKAVVAMTALALHDDGLLDLDEPVRAHLPVSTHAMTARSLLTHSSGLPASILDWRTGASGAGLRERCVTAPVSEGGGHRYSCVGFIVLGALLEEVTGRSLAELVSSEVAQPAGAANLRFAPVAAEDAVATEIGSDGTPARGVVHDELAAAIGSPVGNAGLFGTAEDVLAVARVIRGGGAGPSERVLSEASVRLMTDPAVVADGFGQALGLRVSEDSWMGGGTRRVGHTGFTGTAFVVDLETEAIGVLLTNRVHPRRTDAAAIRAARRAFFDANLGPR